ncbi:MAG: FAD-dependent oxidoreductase [Planctomycetota bacterium]
MKADPRFLTEQGPQIFTGSELLLKGALEVEGGVHLLGGYPGSPIAGFFDSMARIKDLLADKGIRAVINNNEALAAAMLNGSQVAGCRGVICMKSVGVHVAADALALGSLAGAHREGGAVVIYGDDPWSDSTQVPADSRFLSKHLFIPVIEPSNQQEVKDFINLGVTLSRRSELYAGFLMPTNLADGGGTVTCRPNQYPRHNTRTLKDFETAAIDLNKHVLLPPKTWWQEATYAARFQRALTAARELGLNRIDHAPDGRRPVGFATSGMAHDYLVQALWELGLEGEFPVLKFGMSYPLDGGMVRRLARQCERIVVVEERRGFLESQISEVVARDRQTGGPADQVEVWGKTFGDELEGFPQTRGLDPTIVMERIVPLLDRVAGGRYVPAGGVRDPHAELDRAAATGEVEMPALPTRLPSFCPGCPHRDSAGLCLEIKRKFADPEYMAREHGRGPVDLLFHGDIGCYTMLMYPPNTELMHNLSGMGLGGGTGSGMDPFVPNKQVVFMGDSTFFHSGQLAISQAVKLGQDITFIILDNRTTAMTGHQPTPGSEFDIVGNPTAVQDIEDVVQGIAAGADVPIARVDPEKRRSYRELLEQTFLRDGVKVIIADKECAITRLRRQKRADRGLQRQLGFVPRWEHMNVNTDACTFCLACTENTGCPGLKHVSTDYGAKVDTDLTLCVNDGACERLAACSAFERVTIRRKRPARPRVGKLDLDNIPEPQKRPAGEIWRCCLTGVGTQGIGTATQILVRAAHKAGYRVGFLDKKGLAIRGGGVMSQIIYNIAGKPVTPLIPHGKADLLIGIDLLEAARAIDPTGRGRVASPETTAAVVNTDKFPTVAGIMGREDFDVDELEAAIRRQSRPDDYLARNISRICETYLGSKIYANIMMLGFAFQKGLIPVSMHAMAWAVKDTIRHDFRKNLYAFNMGRKLVVNPDLFRGAPERTGWRDVLADKCRWGVRRFGRGQSEIDAFHDLAAETVQAADELDEPLKRAVVVRTYDCLRWGGIDYARRYAEAVLSSYRRDGAEHGHAATRAVIHNLADAMLIKDGIYIAELATHPEKLARDRRKYNVNPANGDCISYRHMLHWRWRIAGRDVSLALPAPSWLMKLLKRMRWLRAAAPWWHRRQREWRAEYERRVADFQWADADEYRRHLAALSAAKCLQCMNPRCRQSPVEAGPVAGCPLGSPVPQWVELARRGQWREAWQRLSEANNFPELTCRLCPAPCQAACKRNAADCTVPIKDIERRITDRALAQGWDAAQPPERRSGKTVAVIGSGPGGLAAAQQLARSGHDVTVFEKADRPGGLLRYGIPDFRLDKSLLDRRLQQLETEGVTFETGVEVGRDIAADELKSRFDAALLAVGASRPRDLKVPGRDKQGVQFALDFLREGGRYQGAERVRDKSVVVIGGGETGNDCAEMALSQGAREVRQLEILPPERVNGDATGPAPDGVRRQWCVATKAFNGGEALAELEAARVRWVRSASGDKPVEQPDTAFTVPADLAVLALGYEPEVDEDLTRQLGLRTDAEGRLEVTNCATSEPGVFVAGDLAEGASYIAQAIASGRRAARRINDYLDAGADAQGEDEG